MNELLYYTYRCMLYNEMLIDQCDSWLSEEEGVKNMLKAIEERRGERKQWRFGKKILQMMRGMFKKS